MKRIRIVSQGPPNTIDVLTDDGQALGYVQRVQLDLSRQQSVAHLTLMLPQIDVWTEVDETDLLSQVQAYRTLLDRIEQEIRQKFALPAEAETE